jgi:hypothetical protein
MSYMDLGGGRGRSASRDDLGRDVLVTAGPIINPIGRFRSDVRTSSVEHEHCDACGFDGGCYDDESLLDALRSQGPAWRDLLAASGSFLRVRPQPEVWSAIEYAAHTRDVIALHVYGVQQALTGHEPVFPPIGADLVESAAATYGEADLDEVVAELTSQITFLAEVAGVAGADEWKRGLTIGDNRSDVRRLLEHVLHDSQHHLEDVERGLDLLRG